MNIRRSGFLVGLGFLFMAGLLSADSNDEAELKGLVSQWSTAMNKSRPEIIADQFHLCGEAIDSLGINWRFSPRMIRALLLKELEDFWGHAKHSFRVTNLIFPHEDFALLHVAHAVRGKIRTGVRVPESTMTVVAFKRDGRWWWMSAWPFLPGVSHVEPRVPPDPFDGTLWTAKMDDPNEKTDTFLFEGGRFVSFEGLRYSREGQLFTMFSSTYSVDRNDSTTVWTSTQASRDKFLVRHWRAEVKGDAMVGSFTEDDPFDGSDEGLFIRRFTATKRP